MKAKAYIRKTFNIDAQGKRHDTGTCAYHLIRVRKGKRKEDEINSMVDFWYISDNDNVNCGSMTLEEFKREIVK